MSTRDVPHLRPIDSNAAVPWHHRRSDPSPQRNIDRSTHHRIWSESNTDHANDRNTRSETAAGLHGVVHPQQNEIRSPLGQEREYNELKVTLSFKNRDGYNGFATLDTGATDNWISDSLSRRLSLPRKSFREEVFVSFEGKLVRSSESVDGHWHYLHQTIPVTFKICNDLAVEVVFGLELLRQVDLVDFEGSSKAKLNKVLVLAGVKAKKGQCVLVHPHDGKNLRITSTQTSNS
jgi:hypothetical protein